MANNITISKGAFNVTIHTSEVNEGFDNKIFLITPPQTNSNQASGPKSVKIIDLLRVTHNLIIKGAITPEASITANTIKDNLISIFKGANISGGTCTLTYDGDLITGYIEKLTLIEKATDEPSDYDSAPGNYSEVIKYEVGITFVEGTQI